MFSYSFLEQLLQWMSICLKMLKESSAKYKVAWSYRHQRNRDNLDCDRTAAIYSENLENKSNAEERVKIKEIIIILNCRLSVLAYVQLQNVAVTFTKLGPKTKQLNQLGLVTKLYINYCVLVMQTC